VNFTKINVLLIGDFMIDKYIFGSSSRLSPEAPVPVILPNKVYSTPGGAANVAVNLSALGAKVSCMGIIGDDENGKNLLELLKKENIDTKYLKIKNTITTTKKRIFCNNKQIARIDTEEIIHNFIPENKIDYTNFDTIILSDYNKGVLNKEWFNEINTNNIIVDPKKENFLFYSNASIITPNLNELKRASDVEIHNDISIVDACKKLIEGTQLEYVVAKKGSDGITIVGKNNYFKHIKAISVERPDVTGAGDTVIASLSLAYAKTKDIELSANFANIAAGIVVSKSGTASVTIDEINNYIKNNEQNN
jgi:rfaE bifunctional protein kinase chain/domain